MQVPDEARATANIDPEHYHSGQYANAGQLCQHGTKYIIRFCLRREMSWRSKPSSESGQKGTTSLGRDEWRSTAVVSRATPFLPSNSPNDQLTPSRTIAAIFGPGATTWFKFLQNKVVLKNPNTTIVARVLTDQIVFASTNLFVFLSSMAIMEGTSPKDKLDSTYFTALQKNWMVWPWVQAINFKLVPLEHRVLVVNVVALGKICQWRTGGVSQESPANDGFFRLELLSELHQ